MSIVECGICVDFLTEATETPCCHKLFCRACIAGWLQQRSNCPVCRAVLEAGKLAPNVVVQRFVDGMTQDCPNGCRATPARADLASHLEACELRPQLVQQKKQERLAQLAGRVEALQKLKSKAPLADLVALSRDLVACNDLVNAQFFAECAMQVPGSKGAGVDEAAELLADVMFAGGSWRQALDAYPKTCLSKVADCQLKLALYTEAEESLKLMLQRDASPQVMGKLGELKKKTSAYAEASQYLSNALRLADKNTALWVELSLSLCDVLRKTERYEESKRMYIAVLKAAESLHGKRSSQVATCLNALGILTKKLGHYEAAIKYYKAAIKLKVFLTGSHNHAQIAEFLTNLGDVYRKQSQYAQAEALYRRSLQIFEATVGPTHIECADTLNSLGLVAKKYARYDEAADLYDRALTIARATFKGQLFVFAFQF